MLSMETATSIVSAQTDSGAGGTETGSTQSDAGADGAEIFKGSFKSVKSDSFAHLSTALMPNMKRPGSGTKPSRVSGITIASKS